MRLLINCSWFLCLALGAAGGGDGPSAPTPRLISITVTGSNLLLVGNDETFIAAGNTGVLTAPRWGSDAPTVATVNADTGQVTVVGIGTATIFVDANGLRGTKLIRTLPNFGGEWSGRYTLVDCINSSAARTACSERSTKDTSPLSMSFTQHRDSVSGSLIVGGNNTDGQGVTWTVSPDGILSLYTFGYPDLDRYVDNVRFESTEVGQMTGTFEEVDRYADGTTVRFVYRLQGVSRK